MFGIAHTTSRAEHVSSALLTRLYCVKNLLFRCFNSDIWFCGSHFCQKILHLARCPRGCTDNVSSRVAKLSAYCLQSSATSCTSQQKKNKLLRWKIEWFGGFFGHGLLNLFLLHSCTLMNDWAALAVAMWRLLEVVVRHRAIKILLPLGVRGARLAGLQGLRHRMTPSDENLIQA